MPTRDRIHQDQLLTNVSIKYRNTNFIADQVCPDVSVKKSSDKFRQYLRNFRIPITARADKGLARTMETEWTFGTYSLEKHALKDYVSTGEIENNDVGDLMADVTEELTDAIYRRKEKMVADLFTKTSWSLYSSFAATGLWTLQTSVSNPIPTFDTAMSVVGFNSGMKPNVCVIPRDSFVAFKNHDWILDRVKYTSREMNEGVAAGLIGVEKLLVPMSSYDSAAEGATETVASIWSNENSWLGYVAPSAGLRVASAMYNFRKSPIVRRWVDEEREGATAIEVQIEQKPYVTASLAGYLIANCI